MLIIVASVLGKQGITAATSTLPTWTIEGIGEVTSAILISVAFLAIGSLGVFFLEIVSAGAEWIIHRIAVHPVVGRVVRPSPLESALLPVPVLALRYYHAQRADVLEFFRLRSRATPGHTLTSEELKSFYEEVGSHIDGLKDPGFLTGFGYWTNVTQDQVKLENRALEVREIYFLILFIIALLVVAFRFNAEPRVWASLSVTLVASLCLAVPVVGQRKQELAIMLVCAYCDNFAVAEGATIEDRAEY